MAIDDLKAFRAAEGKTWAIFNGDSMDFELDRDPEDEPSLSEMTEKALEILSKDKDGFCLMIEGSKDSCEGTRTLSVAKIEGRWKVVG